MPEGRIGRAEMAMHKLVLLLSLVLVVTDAAAFSPLPFTGDNPRNMIALSQSEIVVGNYWGGLYRLNAASGEWLLPTFGPGCRGGDLNISSLATPRDGSDTLLAANGTGYMLMPQGFEFPRAVITTDGGFSWHSVTGIPDPPWHKSNTVSYDPFHPDTALWGGSHNVTYRSTNAGLTWSPLSDSLYAEQLEITWDRAQPGVVFLGTLALLEIQPGQDGRRGILRSTDYGETWTLVWGPESINRYAYVTTIVQDPFDQQRWFATMETPVLGNEEWGPCLLSSVDGGLTWQPWLNGIPGVWRIKDLCADPSEPGRYWIAHGDRGVFRTEDYGATWTEENDGFFAWTAPAGLMFNSNDGMLYAANRQDALYRKHPNDPQWIMVTQNPFDQAVPMREYLVEGTLFGTGYVGCYELHVWPETSFQFWGQPLPDDNPEHIAVDPDNPARRAILANVHHPFYHYSAYVTEDGGQSWSAWGGGILIPAVPKDCGFLDEDTLVVVEQDVGVRHVTAQGHELVYQHPEGELIKHSIQRGSHVVLNTTQGVRYSSDGGRSFTLSSLDAEPFQIAGDPRPGHQLMVATSNRPYRSFDGGATWQALPTTPSTFINGLACYDSLVYAACQWDSTIYVRAGEHPWQPYMDGIPQESFAASSLHADAHGVIAKNTSNRPGSHVYYYSPHFTAGVADKWQPLPLAQPMLNTYPNPFNESTTFSISLPRPGHTHLTIHDLLGREVAVFWDQYMRQGAYTLTWDATGKASGSYYVRLRTPTATLSRRIMIIR